MDTEKIIDIKELDKSFGDIHAVNGLSFCVKKGELFAFLGVNGAGKSTFWENMRLREFLPKWKRSVGLRGFLPK